MVESFWLEDSAIVGRKEPPVGLGTMAGKTLPEGGPIPGTTGSTKA